MNSQPYSSSYTGAVKSLFPMFSFPTPTSCAMVWRYGWGLIFDRVSKRRGEAKKVVSRRHWAGKVFDGVSLEISTGPLNTIRNSFPQHTWTGNSLIEPDQHMWFAVGSFFQDLRTRVLAFYVSRITNLLYIRMSVSGSNPYFACRRDSCFCFWLCIGQWAVTPVFVLFFAAWVFITIIIYCWFTDSFFNRAVSFVLYLLLSSADR